MHQYQRLPVIEAIDLRDAPCALKVLEAGKTFCAAGPALQLALTTAIGAGIGNVVNASHWSSGQTTLGTSMYPQTQAPQLDRATGRPNHRQ